MKTLFELRRLASADIQAIAQTRARLSTEDASTYLDYLVVAIHALRKGATPLAESQDTGTSAFIVSDGLNYFVDEGTFMTTWIGDRTKAKRFDSHELAEQAARRLGKACRVETIEDVKDEE